MKVNRVEVGKGWFDMIMEMKPPETIKKFEPKTKIETTINRKPFDEFTVKNYGIKYS